MLTLKAEIRNINTEPADIRKAGQVPAVFYGKKEASTPIAIRQADFLKVWKEAGESSVVILDMPDGNNKESLIHEVDLDPVTGVPRHADFYVFEKGHKVEVSLPVEFEGSSPAVKDLGGILVKVVHELKIEAMPKDLPHHIIVDVSSLAQFGDQILAKEIKLPHGIELKINPEEVIVTISAPREEKEEEAVPIDLSTIEVSEKRGKEEVEGEEGTPAELKVNDSR